MIVPVKMYSCQCDSCNKQWQDESTGFVAMTDEISISQNVSEDTEWYTHRDKDGDKHYCPDCWGWDDDGVGDAKLINS